ncbi:MAG: hypothetical protein C0436_03940 [Alphaproteobacteria bacterium]|nr:hypothetical protein [Alphaproteobacteria bacterium]
MATFVVGDSVGVGIGQNIRGAQVYATPGHQIQQMGPHFNQALGAISRGDTVVISAGYNSTRAGGIPENEQRQLQGWVQQLRDGGAHVVIMGLRETNIGSGYRQLSGRTSISNQQLAGIAQATGASFAEGAIAIANTIPRGEIHGRYAELAREALAVAGRARMPEVVTPAQIEAIIPTTPVSRASEAQEITPPSSALPQRQAPEPAR